MARTQNLAQQDVVVAFDLPQPLVRERHVDAPGLRDRQRAEMIRCVLRHVSATLPIYQENLWHLLGTTI